MSKMESMGIRRLVISMSVPIALSMLVSALYNIVDSIFVAGYSQDALLAVSLCYPIQTLMIAVACGTGVGFNTLLARYLGQNNGKMADQSVMHGLLLALLNWLVFALAGWFGAKAFMQSFAGDQAVIASGVSYIRICTLFHSASLSRSRSKGSCRPPDVRCTTWPFSVSGRLSISSWPPSLFSDCFIFRH